MARFRSSVAFVLGVGAAFLWPEAMLWWAVHVYSSTLQWLWEALRLKTDWAHPISIFAFNAVFAFVVALVVRLFAGRAWLPNSFLFGVGFLVAFFAPSLVAGEDIGDWTILLADFALVLGGVSLTLLVTSQFPRPQGA